MKAYVALLTQHGRADRWVTLDGFGHTFGDATIFREREEAEVTAKRARNDIPNWFQTRVTHHVLEFDR